MSEFDWIVDEMKKKTPEETKQSLIDCGILDASGQLAEKYRQGEGEEEDDSLYAMSKDELIAIVQAYQELVSGLEGLVNTGLANETGIHPLWVRRLLEAHVYGCGGGDDDFIIDGSRPLD